MCPKADDQYDRPLLKGERARRGEIKSSRHVAFRNIVQEEIKIAMINFASIYPAIWDTEGSVWKERIRRWARYYCNQHPEAFSMSRRERMEQIETMLLEAIIKIYGR